MNFDDLMTIIENAHHHKGEFGIDHSTDMSWSARLERHSSFYTSACEDTVFWLTTVNDILGTPTSVSWDEVSLLFHLTWASEDVYAEKEKLANAIETVRGHGRRQPIYYDRNSIHLYIEA